MLSGLKIPETYDFEKDIWLQGVAKEKAPLKEGFEILKLPVQVDPKRILQDVSEALSEQDWQTTYDLANLRSVRLAGPTSATSYAYNTQDFKIGADGKRMVISYNEEWQKEYSPLYEKLKYVWDKFPNYKILAPRIFKAKTGCIMPLHVDGPGIANFHIALTTNDLCFNSMAGRLYHIPVDGHVYAINASIEHHAFNLGREERIHLIFALINKKSSMYA